MIPFLLKWIRNLTVKKGSGKKIVNDNSYVVQAEMVKQLGAIGKSSDIILIKKLSKEWSPRHIIRKASNRAILLLEGE